MSDDRQVLTEQSNSYSVALASAHLARSRLIALTHELPKDAPNEILRLWNLADTALLGFVRALEDLQDLEDSRS